jgi:hypothetical protein
MTKEHIEEEEVSKKRQPPAATPRIAATLTTRDEGIKKQIEQHSRQGGRQKRKKGTKSQGCHYCYYSCCCHFKETQKGKRGYK